ncbi:uncharacterized protein LOC132295683 [Cornus florida]|uniref:uncharacterized protein LOC132295683 n=1 Tax=Cornus florida TaxID=4283 RepID=UPI0028A1DB74|nr:uncharacterized protein LOC132295683 [Cornus florida]
MASSPLRSKTGFHARSVSLPSRSHPLIPQFEEHLCRVKASEAASISNRPSGLEQLYDCVDELLLLPHTQQVFAQQRHEKWVDEALDRYVRLLDVCAIAKDVFSQAKQDVQELLSILRRRRDTNDFGDYLSSRKKAKKVIQKCLKNLKGAFRNNESIISLDNDHETMAIVSMLSQVEAVTLNVCESMLSYTAGTKVQSRPSRWSLVSKLMHKKNASGQDEETDMNEFDNVDAALHSLIGHKTTMSDKGTCAENVQNQVKKLEWSIQDHEEGLQSLFRRLIKTRVSLLNVLNH